MVAQQLLSSDLPDPVSIDHINSDCQNVRGTLKVAPTRQRTSDLTSEEVKSEDAEARESDETRPTSVDERDTVAL